MLKAYLHMLHIIPQGENFVFWLHESTLIPTEGFCENHTKLLTVLISAVSLPLCVAPCPSMVIYIFF